VQLPAALERKRLGEIQKLRLHGADGTGGRLRRWDSHAGDHIARMAGSFMAMYDPELPMQSIERGSPWL
jgi:hypothetical protein